MARYGGKGHLIHRYAPRIANIKLFFFNKLKTCFSSAQMNL